MKKLCIIVLTLIISMSISTIIVNAYDLSNKALVEKHHDFASQYEYKEGDSDKSLELYPHIPYTSGIEYTKDGKEFECPALYLDSPTPVFAEQPLKDRYVKIVVNNQLQNGKGFIYNSRTLVKYDIFELLGLETDFNEETLVLTIKNSDTVIEILPYLIGMRKNQNEGFYVPLEVCARFLDNNLYIPLRAVADEFDISVEWDADSFTVIMKNTQ